MTRFSWASALALLVALGTADDPASSTADGTQLVIWDCNGGVNQKWTVTS